MKLSVIIPVYNVEDYLAHCLDSVLAQSVDADSYEIIIVNDNSPDNSLAIAEQYEQQYPQVKVISQENGGIASARNTGIQHASGEYIILLDSDDYYSADFFSKVYQLMDRGSDLIMLNFNSYYMGENRHELNQRAITSQQIEGKSGVEAIDFILKEEKLFTWYPWVYIVKRNLILDHDLFFVKNRNYEDLMWTPLVFLYAERVSYYDHPVVEYRLQRPGQITGTVNYKNLSDPIHAPRYLKKRMAKMNVSENVQQKILLSTSSKYFTAPFYGTHLTKNERGNLIRLMKEHEHVLNYPPHRTARVVKKMIQILGYKNTFQILSFLHHNYQMVKKTNK